MSTLRIVVDQRDDWLPYCPTDDLMVMDDFLALDDSPDHPAGARGTRVINLCGDLDYLGTGYYSNIDAGIEDAVLGPAPFERIMAVFLARMEARRLGG